MPVRLISALRDTAAGRRIARGVGANAYAQVVVVAVQLALVPIMAKGWGVDRYGAWLLLSTIPFCLALGDFGFGTAAGIRMTIEVARGDQAAATETLQSAFAAIGVAVMALAGLGTACFLSWPLPDSKVIGLTTSEFRGVLLGLYLYGLAGLFGSVPNAGFRCSGHYALGAILQASTVLVEATVVAVLVLAGAGLAAAAFGYLVTRLLGLIFQVATLHRTVPWLRVGLRRATRERIASLAKPAAAAMTLPLALAIFLQGGTLVVGLAVSAAAVASFTTVRTLTRTGVQMTTLVNHAIMPEMSVAAGRGDGDASRRFVLTTVATSLLINLPLAGVLLAMGPRIIEAWTGGVINPDRTLISVMVAVMVVNGIWFPLSNLLLAVNCQAAYSYVYAALSIVFLGAAYSLCYLLGEVGVAWATLALEIFMLQHVLRKVRLLIDPGAVIPENG